MMIMMLTVAGDVVRNHMILCEETRDACRAFRRTRPRMHTGIYSISMSIDGSESGLIGIPLGWGLYGPEPECTVVELSGEFK